jgi:hypothetical protein
MRRWGGGRVGLIVALLGTAVACGTEAVEGEPPMEEGVAAPDIRVLPESARAAGSNVFRFLAEADAHVQQAQPSKNFGGAPLLEVDGEPRSEVYLRFAVTGLSRPVVSAKLRLFNTNPSFHGPAVYGTASSWNEHSVTWATRPSRRGTAVVTAGAVPLDTWMELDVTPLVSGNGTVALALLPTGTDGADFRSRESGDRAPELVVTLATGGAPLPGGTYTVGAVADAYTDSGFTYVNFNTHELRVDGAPSRMESYLRFELPGQSGDVVSARLRLFALKGSAQGPEVWSTLVDWVETAIGAELEPSRGPVPLLNAGAGVGEGTWLELDVTRAFLGASSVSFGLLPQGSDGMSFASREHPNAAWRPQLVVKTRTATCAPAPGESPASGTYRGGQSWGGPGEHGAQGVGTDAQGHRVLIAYYDGSVDFGGGPLPNQGTGPISDNDVALVKQDAQGHHVWSKGLGAPGSSVTGSDVAVNPAGQIALVGSSSGGVNLGAGVVAAGGFVAKYSPEGTLLWAHAVGGPLRDTAIDAEGQVYAVGELEAAPALTARVLKFSATGTLLWDQRFNATGTVRGVALAVGPSGELAVGGSYSGTLKVGSHVLPESPAAPFLVKLLPSGQVAWARGIAADTYPYAERSILDLAIAPDGAIVGVGAFSEWIRLGTEQRLSTGAYSGFLLVVEPDGRDRWWRWMGNTSDTMARGVAVDAGGDVVVMGTFRGALDFGGGLLTTLVEDNHASEGFFIAKYRLACGEHRWSQQLSHGGYVWAHGLSVAPDRSISLTGLYYGSFGEGFPEDEGGSSRAVMFRFDP